MSPTKVEETVSSAFQYEINKLDKENTKKEASGSGIDKTELEGMSSFFAKILSNPFAQEKDFAKSNDTTDDVSKRNDVKTATTSLDVSESRFSTNSNTSNVSGATEKINVQTEPSSKIAICENATSEKYIPTTDEFQHQVSCISNQEPQQIGTSYAPSIPSPSRYGAIEALDEGDEQREREKWADRTETITRFEHER